MFPEGSPGPLRRTVRHLVTVLLVALLLPGLAGGPVLAVGCSAAVFSAAERQADHSHAGDERDRGGREAPPCRLATMPALPAATAAITAGPSGFRWAPPAGVAFRSVAPRQRKHRPKCCPSA